jgi:sporulation protein YlmC with PRC-barrel domain
MRGKLSIVLLAVGMVLALSAVLQAADPPVMPGQQQQPGMSPQPGMGPNTMKTDPNMMKTEGMGANSLCRATDVIGMEVWNQNQKEQLGTIENFAIDHNNGQIRYVVVSIPGTMGERNKLVPLPWQALKAVMTEKTDAETIAVPRYFTLDLDRTVLAKAPSFQQGQWPDFSDQRWVTAIQHFYGPYLAKRSGETRSE